jgi:hypothetical protein
MHRQSDRAERLTMGNMKHNPTLDREITATLAEAHFYLTKSCDASVAKVPGGNPWLLPQPASSNDAPTDKTSLRIFMKTNFPGRLLPTRVPTGPGESR